MKNRLITLCLALGLSSLCVGQTMRERKNIDSLTSQELAAYKHAVSMLKQSSDPKNNYQYHANLHNLFLFTPPHGCENRNDLFFPWHRYHLANFERALQATDPDHVTLSTRNVTVPYWNWTQAASGVRYPNAFETPTDANGQPNPIYNDVRNTAALSPIYDETYMTGIVRNNRDWNQFAGGLKDDNEFYGALESPAQNTMHGSFIGGDMADPNLAAEDPIYWSYHAFIDMQWDRWQKIHKKPLTSGSKELPGFEGAPLAGATGEVSRFGYFYTHSASSIAPIVVVSD